MALLGRYSEPVPRHNGIRLSRGTDFHGGVRDSYKSVQFLAVALDDAPMPVERILSPSGVVSAAVVVLLHKDEAIAFGHLPGSGVHEAFPGNQEALFPFRISAPDVFTDLS